MAISLTGFDAICALPACVNFAALGPLAFDEGAGIEATLNATAGKWHKSCRLTRSIHWVLLPLVTQLRVCYVISPMICQTCTKLVHLILMLVFDTVQTY